MNFFRKVIGGDKAIGLIITNQPTPTIDNPLLNGEPEILQSYRKKYKWKSLKELNDLYFVILEQIIDTDKKGDIRSLLMHCQATFELLESLITYNVKEYGSFDIKTIPALDKALLYYAIYGDTVQLRNIQEIIDFFQELHYYKRSVEEAFIRRDLAASIYGFVKANPNFPQANLKKSLGFYDSQLISDTVYYMEKVGNLIRKKNGNRIYISVG